MIFEVDKQLKELGDELIAEDKATVENELAEFKKVRETNDAEQIKNAMEAFTQKVYGCSARSISSRARAIRTRRRTAPERGQRLIRRRERRGLRRSLS